MNNNVLKGIKIAVIGGIMSLVVAGSAFAASKEFGNSEARWTGACGSKYVYSYVEDLKGGDRTDWHAHVWVDTACCEHNYYEGNTTGVGKEGRVFTSLKKDFDVLHPWRVNEAGYKNVYPVR